MTKIKQNSGETAKSPPEFVVVHEEACRKEQDSYLDPETGFHVLTSYYLKTRGNCCTNKCRHCPYGFHKDAWPYTD